MDVTIAVFFVFLGLMLGIMPVIIRRYLGMASAADRPSASGRDFRVLEFQRRRPHV